MDLLLDVLPILLFRRLSRHSDATIDKRFGSTFRHPLLDANIDDFDLNLAPEVQTRSFHLF
jgi:hypothetical protein